MNFGKNLTGEQKGTFSSLDITQSLNIDDNASIMSTGNIVSSGSICATHGDLTIYKPIDLIVIMHLLQM